jgi:hypothetical protein
MVINSLAEKTYIVMICLLCIGGCGWGEVPLHSQMDALMDQSDLEFESLVIYSDEDIYIMIGDFPPLQMFDGEIEGDKNVGFTSFRGEDSSSR